MKLEHTEYFDILRPEEGRFLAAKDLSCVFQGEIYLGTLDCAENYIEISEEEYNEIKATTEAI